MSEAIQEFFSPEIWRDRLYLGGWRKTEGGVLEIAEPATGRCLATVGGALPADVAAAAAEARTAQREWAALSGEARARILLRAAELVESHAEDLIVWMMRETGSVRAKAAVELEHGAGFVRAAAAMAVEAPGRILPAEAGRISMARRVPHGTVGIISPFNFPFVLSIRAVAPALAAGNAVILKPDPQTPLSGGFMIARLFEAAGLPAGLLHVQPGGAEVGQALCADPGVAMIAFTGSTGAGRRVGELAGRHLKKVQLELGGKNALIVLDDVDPDLAASNAAWGAWLHQGQICMSTGRILAQATIADALVERLVAIARRLPVGDPTTDRVALGPLINRRQLAHVHGVVEASVAAGARLLTGGQHDGLFYQPTVLAGVTPGMPAFEEEVFGPVAVVTEFETDEEAAALANRSDFGLAAGILSGSVGRAMALGEQLATGHLHINDQTVAAEPHAPFGGFGASGNGSRISGPANWEEFTQWQWVTIRQTPPRYPF